MLSKCNGIEEGYLSIGVEGKLIPQDELYRNGCLWRNEAEQIYRWVPAAKLSLEPGEHTLTILALASGMRFDRFYLTTGDEQPPMDTEWRAK